MKSSISLVIDIQWQGRLEDGGHRNCPGRGFGVWHTSIARRLRAGTDSLSDGHSGVGTDMLFKRISKIPGSRKAIGKSQYKRSDDVLCPSKCNIPSREYVPNFRVRRNPVAVLEL